MSGDLGQKEELEYFFSVLSTFKSYRDQSLLRIQHKENCLKSLPANHVEWLKKYQEDLMQIRRCIEKNAELIPLILRDANSIFGAFSNDGASHSETQVGTSSEGLDKVQSVFKQLTRDWSSMGAEERHQCYDPIIEEICRGFPEGSSRKNIKVLVPGAGLGRLAFEIASRGFSCQGNEFNMFMLIVSYFVLNVCKKVDEYLIYPWIHQFCNILAPEDQMIGVRFPDVRPMPPEVEDSFSMVAGDFLEVYTTTDEWHCVATCFFIDCAPNVVQFIERIYQIIKPGGLWINLGPLLYHYSDMPNERSIEPSFKVVCDIIEKIGFEMESCKTGVKTKYCQNVKSMLQAEYDSVFFVCRKPIVVSNGVEDVEVIDERVIDEPINDDGIDECREDISDHSV